MFRTLLLPLLVCCATLAHAAPKACTTGDPTPSRLARDEHGDALKIARCLRWTDRTGDYQLYLLASEDRRDGDYTLSKSLAAQLFRKQPDGTLAARWVIHDRIEEGEAGAWFSKNLSEFPSLDGDGVVTPLLVLRFVGYGQGDPSRPVDYDAYAGRLKLILFHGDTKVAVRAVTGGLDDERHTTASDSFFELPRPQQRYLQNKLRNLARDELFVADDVDDYRPKREKHR